ncbi:hypothetical protein [Pontibacter lucknowensis]|uniref:Uncharacterized protein n=1 Tax=Pontibacter lucknowensis TaxID=1077936 RepID=A0A1N6TI78_9BACT|nr:hypothetical protein [Pontibacter lucknowensis]SIQ53082.1 hypothetical protein SAMN05421545_0347 [Pontibacter lucknowensis]
MDKKTIDINQRIPLHILEVALKTYLSGNYTSNYIIEQLRLEFTGENRLRKAARIVDKIITRNPLNNWLLANRDELQVALSKKSDRNLIIIALLNTAFPFSYDVLRTFGKYFLAQDVISTESIRKSIASIYGSNRATDNAIYSIVPMYLDAGLFKRKKLGVYEFLDPVPYTFPVSKQLYIESFKESLSIDELQDYQLMDPYFRFVEV